MLDRIKHGFFLGLGFAVAVLGLSFVSTYVVSLFLSPEREEQNVVLSDLHVEHTEIVQRDNKLVILGSVTNSANENGVA